MKTLFRRFPPPLIFPDRTFVRKPTLAKEPASRPVNVDSSVLASTLGDRGGGVSMDWVARVQPTIDFRMPPPLEQGYGFGTNVADGRDGLATAKDGIVNRVGAGASGTANVVSLIAAIWDIDWWSYIRFDGTTAIANLIRFRMLDPLGGTWALHQCAMVTGTQSTQRGAFRVNLRSPTSVDRWVLGIFHDGTVAGDTLVAQCSVFARRVATPKQQYPY